MLVELSHGALSEIVDRRNISRRTPQLSHFARAYVQRKFASLYNVTDPNDGRGPLMAASVEGESFDLTLLLSAISAVSSGFPHSLSRSKSAV